MILFHIFISTILFHHYILLLYITFGSCDEMLSPCPLFTLGAKASLGWLHFRNVAPKSLPSCFLSTTSIRLSNPCTDSCIPFILTFLLLSHLLPVFALIITPYGPLPSMASVLSSFHTCSVSQPFDSFF